ncbi:hypothetical protein GGG16DRAFT_60553 [Schizophyllum commune]
MSSPEIMDILREVSGKLTPENAPATLSSILGVFFRHRFQPPDPDYTSESACRGLLETHSSLYSLLEKAVAEKNDSSLWACDILAFQGVELRTRRPIGRAEATAERELGEMLNRLRESISAFANAPLPVERWSAPPSDSPSPYSDFISSLRMINMGPSRPCTLIHELGQHVDNSVSDVLRNLFTPGQHVLYVNAFGTGKTRLIFEGLCRRWGFYIPCALGSDRLGSVDMQMCLDMDMSRAYGFQRLSPWSDAAVARNRDVAQYAFSRVLLTRLIIFKIFLDELADKKAPDAPLRWLLLQVLTQKLEPFDIFDDVTRVLSQVSDYYIDDMTSDLLLDIKARLDGSETTLFCVLDSCESASRLYTSGAFGAGTTFLRELVRSSEGHDGLTIILSGSYINLEPFQDSGTRHYTVYSNTGALLDRDAQRRYIQRYLPPTLAQSTVGKELLKRCWHWLRGRYVLLRPSFVTCLLTTRFEHPLLLLDFFIAAVMCIEPPHVSQSDLQALQTPRDTVFISYKGREHSGLSGGETPVFSNHLNADRSLDRQALLAARFTLFKIILTGEDCVRFTGSCSYPLVVHGVAHFTDSAGREAIIHEPAVLMPLESIIFPKSNPMHGFYPDELAALLTEAPSHDAHHLVFIMTVMRALEQRAHRLNELFQFAGIDPSWTEQTVQLVRVFHPGGGRSPHARVYKSALSSMSRETTWATDSAEWLSHETKAPFCLSSGFSHADVLFVLRLEDGRLLYVALAVLFKNAHVEVDAAKIQAKFAQLAPHRLFKLGRTRSSQTSGLRLHDLPKKVEEAGDPPLLRVVATYPYEMDINEIKHDGLAHPIAAVRTTNLREFAQTIDLKDVMRRLKNVMTVPRGRKRKATDAAPPPVDSPKRPRTRSVTAKAEAARGRRGPPQRRTTR